MSAQTLGADFIVWQNESHVDISDLKDKYNFSHVHSKDYNWKYHGRFTLPLMLTTKYTVILDDDTLPNPKWLESCVDLCEKQNCIVGGNGRLLDINNPRNEIAVDQPDRDHEVDYVGHAWFFRTEWARDFWKDPIVSHYTAEDIAFCASLKVNLGIRSFVPDFTQEDKRGDSDKWKYGVDDNVIQDPVHVNRFFDERLNVIKHWAKKGWKPCS
tara:strand:- start:144 stop:782 length:639 start_codon:yes stop_codon:yes gene_type:complete